MSLFPGQECQVLSAISRDNVEPAVSVRLCLKTHGSDNSLNVCPVVEDEMDDDVMDDKEEPSEESTPVKGGQSRVVIPTLKKTTRA